jgi:hypothetical protein
MLFVNVFNVYVTTRLVEDHADTYGALGVAAAAALLFSLVLVGNAVVRRDTDGHRVQKKWDAKKPLEQAFSRLRPLGTACPYRASR